MLKKLKKLNIITKKGHCKPSVLTKFSNVKHLVLKETQFLDVSALLLERLYCIKNNIKQIPLCKQCGNKVKFANVSIGYKMFCSKKCSTKNKGTQEKRKKTCMEKFGVDHPGKSKEIQEKAKRTNIQKYGIKNYRNIEKAKETNFKKLGTHCPLQSEKVKRKIKLTNLKRYGVENPSQSELIKSKKITTYLKRYGVENPSQSVSIQNKKRNNNKLRYSRNHFNQQHISEDSLNKLNDKEWLQEQHYNKQKPLIQIAKELGICDGTVGRYLHKHGLETVNHNYGILNETIFSQNPNLANSIGCLYIIHCYNENESFIKVGITNRTIKKRFYNFQYKYNILLDLELPYHIAWRVEQDILHQFNKHSYQPNIEFAGQYECLNESCYEDIMEYLQ